MLPLNYHVRLYCERHSNELWAEPVNTLSNIGFFIAAWLLWKLYRDHRKNMGNAAEIPILIVIILCIGTGSAIFHSVATMGAVFFDVIPIIFFVFFYLYVFSRSVLKLGKMASAGLFILLVLVNIVFKYYVFRAIDGYVSYIPTFLFLLMLAFFMLVKRHPSAKCIIFASILAFISLYFRTIDREACSIMPIGTHFLWHLFNAWLIYILVRELMRSRIVKHGNA